MTTPFRFKLFTVVQENSAFKVGTDSVLLGAWANVADAEKILDVGTGTGILALMVAQRNSNAKISGIDIDSISVREASNNFACSLWANRLQAIHIDLHHYTAHQNTSFDLIISNPPYFSHSLKPENPRVYTARHQQDGWVKWMSAIASLMTPSGVCTIIIPVTEKTIVLQAAGLAGLHAARICSVHTRSDLPASRLMVEFTLDPLRSEERTSLAIYKQGEKYHEDFLRLTGDYYLT